MSSLDTQLSEKQAERTQLEAALPALKKTIDEAKEAHADAENAPKAGTPEFEATKEALAEHGIAKTKINKLREEEAQLVALLHTTGDVVQKDRAAAHLSRDASGGGWNAEALLADEGIRAAMGRIASSTGKFGQVELGYAMDQAGVVRHGAEIAGNGAMAVDVAATILMRQGENLGVQGQVRRPLTILDLIAKGTATSGNSLDYIKEMGSFDGAREQVEAELKAEAELTFEDVNEPFCTIANWKKVQKQTLEDAPYIQSVLDSRLRYGVFRRLEKQIVSGDGAAPNLRGIRTRPGVGVTAWAGGNVQADKVLDGITSVLLAEGNPNGIVLFPTAWASMLKTKATGDGQYISGGPFSPTPLSLWGYPVVPNTGVTSNEALVGDFQEGAQLFYRSGIRLLMSDSDSDDFRRNRVTFLAELRAGLAVYREAWFNLVALA